MKVYFTASITGKTQYLKNYLAIVRHLESKGHTVQAHHILDRTESEMRIQTKEDRLKFHKQLIAWIQQADCMIVEASFPSISVGYEISLALQNRKPVLILYSEGDAPNLFASYNDEKLICEKYSLETVNGIIDDFTSFASGAADTRFTFFITPKIAAFLDKISVDKKIPKSVYLRKLIEDHIANTSL
jgi:hypothetical protein